MKTCGSKILGAVLAASVALGADCTGTLPLSEDVGDVVLGGRSFNLAALNAGEPFIARHGEARLVGAATEYPELAAYVAAAAGTIGSMTPDELAAFLDGAVATVEAPAPGATLAVYVRVAGELLVVNHDVESAAHVSIDGAWQGSSSQPAPAYLDAAGALADGMAIVRRSTTEDLRATQSAFADYAEDFFAERPAPSLADLQEFLGIGAELLNDPCDGGRRAFYVWTPLGPVYCALVDGLKGDWFFGVWMGNDWSWTMVK